MLKRSHCPSLSHTSALHHHKPPRETKQTISRRTRNDYFGLTTPSPWQPLWAFYNPCLTRWIFIGGMCNFPGQWHWEHHGTSLRAQWGVPSYHSLATQTLWDICDIGEGQKPEGDWGRTRGFEHSRDLEFKICLSERRRNPVNRRNKDMMFSPCKATSNKELCGSLPKVMSIFLPLGIKM